MKEKILLLLLHLTTLTKSFLSPAHFLYQNKHRLHQQNYNNEPQTEKNKLFQSQNKLISSIFKVLSGSLLLNRKVSHAIGTLSELSHQSYVLQDIKFNVPNTYIESEALQAIFQGTLTTIRTTVNKNSRNTTTLAFGPNSYTRPQNYFPGVTSFFGNGGHSTITLTSDNNKKKQNDPIITGNGIQYLKFGSEVLRISKAIEKGKFLLSTLAFHSLVLLHFNRIYCQIWIWMG
jgi:hypothetical protein